MITWENVALAALGVGCFVIAGIFPDQKMYLLPMGTGLIGWAAPTPKAKKPGA